MSSEAQVALIVGLIAAASGLAGALGGTALGWWLNRASERRSEKRAAFVALLTALDDCQHECTDLRVFTKSPRSESELSVQRGRVIETVNQVETAMNVTILSTNPQDESVLRTAKAACLAALGNAVKGLDSNEISAARRQIIELARRELR